MTQNFTPFFSSHFLLRLCLGGLLAVGGLFNPTPIHADTYVQPTMPPTNAFLYGNSSRHQVGSTSSVSGTGYYYRYITPNSSWMSTPGVKFPVVIWLHWAGNGDLNSNYENTTNLAAAYQVNVPALVATANPNNAQNYPCFLVIPQGSHGSISTMTWQANYNGPDSNGTTGTSQAGSPMKALANILSTLNDVYPGQVDLDRVALTGISAGSFGSYNLPSATTGGASAGGLNLFSCVAPVSGGVNATVISNFPDNLPLWVSQAADDNVVGSPINDAAVAAMRQRGKQVIYTRWNTGAHTDRCWINTYTNPLFMPWVYNQVRGENNQFGIIPQIQNYSTSFGTSASADGTASPNNNYGLVGWTSDQVDSVASGSDGTTDGSHAKMTTATNLSAISPSVVGDRVGITFPGSKLITRYYQITSLTGTSTMNLSALYLTGDAGDSSTPPSGSSLPWTIYPPGHLLFAKAGSGGTVASGTSHFTWSGAPLTGTGNVLQTLGEASAYTVPTFTVTTSNAGTYHNYYENSTYGGNGGTITVNNPSVADASTAAAPTIHYDSQVVPTDNNSQVRAAINLINNHFVTLNTLGLGTKITVTGTASAAGSASIASITWSSSNGYFGTATGTTTWTASGIPIVDNDNILTFTVTDSLGGKSTEIMDVTCVPVITSNLGDYQQVNWNYTSHTASVVLPYQVTYDTTQITSAPALSWILVSGPNTPSYNIQQDTNPAGLITGTNTVTFTSPGTYWLRLRARYGTDTATLIDARGDVLVSVMPNGSVTKAIDCGGSGGTGTAGTYVSDSSSSGGVNATAHFIITDDRINAVSDADKPLLQSYKIGNSASSDLTYNVSVANGHYDVVLQTVEPYQAYAFAGLRKFNIAVAGTTVESNFDLGALSVPFNEVDVVVPNVNVTSGTLSIALNHTSYDFPVISGIVIRSYRAP